MTYTMDTDTTLTSPDDAVQALIPGLTPGALIEIAEDPEAAPTYARMAWYKRMVALMAKADSGLLTVAQEMELTKLLQRAGRLENPPAVSAGAGESGFRININIPAFGVEPARTHSMTIEAAAPTVVEDEE